MERGRGKDCACRTADCAPLRDEVKKIPGRRGGNRPGI